ncbi:P2-like prophage tail protein X [Paenibacillus uliginis N3/975]|uniref:p2-like prophage tail protein X n=1 Tax=Paenibacillus uliginis N3/975 TaxID=1313296 RepID=A0A1X7HK34_9BACL|nr:tail protein X [Paenibacillus uliginis]SMF88146.1 P2-like prophage tail protein X [Paenibacillus uliginis N3/975]
MKTYRTIQGDTWDGIAFSIAGKESFMTQLMNANPDHVEFVIFPAGIILNVPEVPVSMASTLPPWRLEDDE